MEKYIRELSATLDKLGLKEESREVLAQLSAVDAPAWELVDRMERMERTSEDVQMYLSLKGELEALRRTEGAS